MFDLLNQTVCCRLSDTCRVLTDRRQLRLQHMGKKNPVVARDRDIIRNTQATLPDRIDPAKRRKIIRIK